MDLRSYFLAGCAAAAVVRSEYFACTFLSATRQCISILKENILLPFSSPLLPQVASSLAFRTERSLPKEFFL